MYKKFARGMSALAVSAMLLGAQPTQACCFTDWCSCSWFKSKPVCPPPPAPACAVCPQQISFIPQTSFRSESACVPCTTCQPACACDPCGGAQTVMQPVTSFVRRPVMVPYTTMRPRGHARELRRSVLVALLHRLFRSEHWLCHMRRRRWCELRSTNRGNRSSCGHQQCDVQPAALRNHAIVCGSAIRCSASYGGPVIRFATSHECSFVYVAADNGSAADGKRLRWPRLR